MEKRIKKAVKELDIDEKSKQLIGKLIYAELFKVIHLSYHLEELKIEKYSPHENDSRVWVKCSLLVNMGDDSIFVHPFRPFIDTAEMQNVSGGIRLSKTYYLYSEND